MDDPQVKRGSVEKSRDGRPAGILVLDRPPPVPSPLLGAYLWTRERIDHSTVPSDDEKKPRPWALMVGPKGSLPEGDWAFAV
jgi:hypothetical protein